MTGSGFLDINFIKICVLSCIASLTNTEYSIFVETQRMNNSKNGICPVGSGRFLHYSRTDTNYTNLIISLRVSI